MTHASNDFGLELVLPASATVALRRRFPAVPRVTAAPSWGDAMRPSPAGGRDEAAAWATTSAIADNLGLL